MRSHTALPAVFFIRGGPECRLDVSSLGLKGSLSCPNSTVYGSWPPPPPPLPKPCNEGPDPRRGCPHYEWYYSNATVRCPYKAPALRFLLLNLSSCTIAADRMPLWAGLH